MDVHCIFIVFGKNQDLNGTDSMAAQNLQFNREFLSNALE